MRRFAADLGDVSHTSSRRVPLCVQAVQNVPDTIGKPRLLLLTCLLAWVGSVHAFGFGHARLLSGAGQALRADIPVVELRAQELTSLRVDVAPEAAWRQAGLTPPVDLSSLRIQLLQGLTDGTRIVRITSNQTVAGTVADFLIDVQTSAGVQRYQVSMLVQRSPLVLADGVGDAQTAVPAAAVTVRRGDTLFFIAQQHAVSGFSAYQMMAALFYANSSAFMDGNMNLLKAGAALRLPDAAALSRLTDRQARQLFIQHAQAYALRRGKGLAVLAVDGAAGVMQAEHEPASASERVPAQGADVQPPQDQLRLRVANGAGAAMDVDTALADAGMDPATQAAVQAAAQDSLTRIAQLEDNIQELNQLLQERTQVREAAQTRERMPLDAVQTAQTNGVRAQSPVATASRAPQHDAVASAASAQAHDAAVSATGQGSAATAAQSTPTAQQGALAASSPTAAQNAMGVAPAQAFGQDGAAAPAVSASNAGAGAGAGAGAAVAVPAVSMSQISQTQGAGLTNTLWIMIAAGAALLVLLVAWLRRRARVGAGEGGKITDAMIQEKLNVIDLDLHRDDPPSRKV